MNQIGSLGIAAIILLAAVVLWRWDKTSGPAWNTLIILLVIGGTILLIQGTVGFGAFVNFLVFLFDGIGTILIAIGNGFQSVGEALDNIQF